MQSDLKLGYGSIVDATFAQRVAENDQLVGMSDSNFLFSFPKDASKVWERNPFSAWPFLKAKSRRSPSVGVDSSDLYT